MAKKKPNWLEQHIPADLVESKLFKFRTKLNKEESIEVDLTVGTDIDYEKLEEQLADCPQQLIFWGVIYSTLRAHGAIVERRIKSRRGVLIEEAVKLIKEDNTVAKLNADQIKMVIEKDDVLNQLEELYIRVQRDTGKVYYMVQATQMRAESMRSLGGFKKIEMANP